MDSAMCPSELQLKADEEYYEAQKKTVMDDLKEDINNFLWMKLSGLTTLDDGDSLFYFFPPTQIIRTLSRLFHLSLPCFGCHPALLNAS